MLAQIGDTVIILKNGPANNVIDCKGTITEIRQEFFPASAVVEIDGSLNWVYLKNIEVIPPEASYFQHGDIVIVKKLLPDTRYHIARPELLNKTGEIRGWDSRDNTYQVEYDGGGFMGRAWFPLGSLAPVNYIDDIFYYPNDVVVYEQEQLVVKEIKRTKLGTGQLLKLRNEWVPSSEVVPA